MRISSLTRSWQPCVLAVLFGLCSARAGAEAARPNPEPAKSDPPKSEPAAAKPSPESLEAKAAPIEHYRLDNGLEVVLVPDPRLPRVAVSVRYFVGAGDDPNGYRGLAHLTEHLMFEGLRDEAHRDFFEYLENGGSTDANATTDLDRTIYFEELPKERLELALWLESTRMAFLLNHLKPADLERARAAVLNEWDMRVGGGGLRALWALVSEELYPEGHPYRLPNDHPKDLEAIELRHVQWFFQRYYGPNNARLVVVGDFDPKATRERISTYFGPLRARGPAPKPPRAQMPTLRAEHRLEVEWPFKNQLCAFVWPTPLVDPADRAAMDVVMNHLNTLIYHRLVREQGTARYTWSSQDDLARGTALNVVVSFDAEKSRDEVLKGLGAMIDRVRQGGLSDKALSQARQRLTRRAFIAGESLSQRAYALAQADHVERDELEARAARYAAVRSEDVQRVASTWLLPQRQLRLCATHDEDAPNQGKLVDREILDGVKP